MQLKRTMRSFLASKSHMYAYALQAFAKLLLHQSEALRTCGTKNGFLGCIPIPAASGVLLWLKLVDVVPRKQNHSEKRTSLNWSVGSRKTHG